MSPRLGAAGSTGLSATARGSTSWGADAGRGGIRALLLAELSLRRLLDRHRKGPRNQLGFAGAHFGDEKAEARAVESPGHSHRAGKLGSWALK